MIKVLFPMNVSTHFIESCKNVNYQYTQPTVSRHLINKILFKKVNITNLTELVLTS